MVAKIPVLLAVCLLGPACAAPAMPPATPPATPYVARTLSAAQASADVALLRRALETIHPGLYRYRNHADIDAAFARLQASASAPLSELALWQALALMLAEIHCDHTKPEASDALSTYRREQPTHLPLRFQLIEGRMIVSANDGQPGAPPAGSEITAINGRPLPHILTTLGRAVAYDGDASHAIDAKLAADSDLAGDDLNEYWPAFYGFAPRWELTWKAPGAEQLQQATLAPITLQQWSALPTTGAAWRAEFYKDVRWQLDGQRAYLRLDSFVNYRNPVDADAYLGAYFKAMKAAGTTDLILDLRSNGGGSDEAAIALGRYLLPQRFTWSQPARLKTIRYGDLPQYIATWGDRDALFQPPASEFRRSADGWWQRLPRRGHADASVVAQPPAADGYRGRLTILTGPRNASAATHAIGLLQQGAHARLVGEDTAGSAEGVTAGTIFLLTLPNSGLKVRIPNAWQRSTVLHAAPRRGVAADVVVTPTYADLLAGRDAVRDVAQALPPAVTPAQFEAALTGSWHGTLDYRDYGNDQRVILPTSASISVRDAALRVELSYDDGPGKTVHSSQDWQLGNAGTQLSIDGNAAPQRVTESRSGAAQELTLVAEGRGQDNGQDVEVRSVLTRRAGILTLSRQTRLPGQPWLLRHAYHLRHAD
ncbi:MAG: S41 family peptidase [Sphingomonadaceae bacterium]